ncbi:MAG: SoxR reducing system RseC family protein [Candidatus Aceula meridiana]|nr:SoxR reducing system RseC family protein [Candidatus Aceula meridiana]
MVKLTQPIEHQGIVAKVNEKIAEVKIEATSACAQCHAKGACVASDMAEKIIEVKLDGSQVSLGQTVTVTLARSLGIQAVLLGYIFPFVLALGTLIIALHLTKREVTAGVSALVILFPYYFGLYLIRHRIKEIFQFKLKI